MPIIKSAKKRVRTTRKATVRNAKFKSDYRAAIKAFNAAVTGKKGVAEAQAKAVSALDVAVKKHLVSKPKAARAKARMAASAKAAGVAKPTAKKAAPKKPAPAKKPVAKKPAVKKAPAKKK